CLWLESPTDRVGAAVRDWPRAPGRTPTRDTAAAAAQSDRPVEVRRSALQDTRAPDVRAPAAPDRILSPPCSPADRRATFPGSSCREPSRRAASNDRGPL